MDKTRDISSTKAGFARLPMALRWILRGRGWYLLSCTLRHSPVCEPVQWRATLWQKSLTNCGNPPVVLYLSMFLRSFRVFCKKWLFPLPSATVHHCKARLPGLDWDRNPGCADIFEAMAWWIWKFASCHRTWASLWQGSVIYLLYLTISYCLVALPEDHLYIIFI